MVIPESKDRIVRDVDALPADMQRLATDLVHGLVSGPSRGVPGARLAAFAGSIDGASAEQISRAVEEGCEIVDASQW